MGQAAVFRIYFSVPRAEFELPWRLLEDRGFFDWFRPKHMVPDIRILRAEPLEGEVIDHELLVSTSNRKDVTLEDVSTAHKQRTARTPWWSAELLGTLAASIYSREQCAVVDYQLLRHFNPTPVVALKTSESIGTPWESLYVTLGADPSRPQYGLRLWLGLYSALWIETHSPDHPTVIPALCEENWRRLLNAVERIRSASLVARIEVDVDEVADQLNRSGLLERVAAVAK